MAQFGRPNSDITTTNWSTSSGSGTLASHIDETTFSDTDYILTTTDDASCEVALSSVTDPAVSTGHIVRWRWRVANAGGGGERGGAFLVQGATTKATLATAYGLNRTAYDAMSYTLTGTVIAPNDSANSFFIDIDSDPANSTPRIWDILPFSSTYSPRVVSWRGSGTYDRDEFNPKWFDLAAGTHTLYLRAR